MGGLWGKVKSKMGAGRSSSPSTPASADPEAEPTEVSTAARPQSERDLLSVLADRCENATKRLQEFLPEIAIGIAYEDGNQWVEWKRDADGRGRLIDTRLPSDLAFYRACNLLRPMVLTNVARFTSGRPDVIATPLSTAQLDHEATEEARAVLDWYGDRLDFRDTLRRLTHYNQCGTVAFERFWWDPRAKAAVPGEGSFQPEPPEDEYAPEQMEGMPSQDEAPASLLPPKKPLPAEATGPTGYTEAPVGDLRSDVILGHQVLADPRAKTFDDIRWIETREVLSLADVEERYGVKVKSESQRRDVLQNIADESMTSRWFDSAMPPKAVTVCTHYERESKKYPKGRTIAYIEGQVLAQELSLPCGVIPLVPLQYQPRLDSVYGRNLVAEAAEPQRSYNEARSGIGKGLKRHNKLTTVREMGDAGGADVEEMLDEGPSSITLWYRKGSNPPQMTLPPFDANANIAAMEVYKQEMSDLLGVHIVSSGQGDPNAKSGYAIRLLQDSDRTMHAPYVQAIERFVEERARMILKFVSHYVAEPRVWGLDDADNPQEANQRVSALPALRAGGAVAVKVIEASGTPRTPEAMDEEVLGLFNQGLAGDPADPATRKAVLESLQSPAATRLKERLEKAMMEFPMPPPTPPGSPPSMPAEAPAPPPIPDPMTDPMMAALTQGGAPLPPMAAAPPMLPPMDPSMVGSMDPSMGLPPL